MKLDIGKLEKYDFGKARAGDRIIILRNNGYRSMWGYEVQEVKSVSAKRGDVTFNNNSKTKFDRTGRRMGKHYRYDTSQTVVVQYSPQNIQMISEYGEYAKKVREVRIAVDKMTFESIAAIPDDDLNRLHEVLMKIMADENAKRVC